jgi:arginyl-tRNA synthetase
MTESEIAAIPQNIIDKLAEKFHHFNVDHDWWDSTYDSFKDRMNDVGIEVENMHFSGFWSQGDGACFEGYVSDWNKFLTHMGYEDAPLIKHASHGWSFKVVHQGHYYHENCTSFTSDMPLPENVDDENFSIDFSPHHKVGELRDMVWRTLLCKYNEEKLHDEFVERFKSHMRTLYKELEDEYDHLTSETCILESLNANDMLEDEVKQLTEELENA